MILLCELKRCPIGDPKGRSRSRKAPDSYEERPVHMIPTLIVTIWAVFWIGWLAAAAGASLVAPS
jgi:hypothetical protein